MSHPINSSIDPSSSKKEEDAELINGKNKNDFFAYIFGSIFFSCGQNGDVTQIFVFGLPFLFMFDIKLTEIFHSDVVTYESVVDEYFWKIISIKMAPVGLKILK